MCLMVAGMSNISQTDGGRLLLATGIIVAAGAGGALVAHGPGEEGIRLIIRQTALISLLLFSSAFAASSAVRLWPSGTIRWMMRNRRWLGLSFALSHFAHLGAVIALSLTLPDFIVEPTTKVLGSLAYVFIAAMAATSFNGAVQRMGKESWHLLHKTGAYYIWLIFALSYLPRASSPAYWPHSALVLTALAIRFAAYRSAAGRRST